jgi:hypothetical protein
MQCGTNNQLPRWGKVTKARNHEKNISFQKTGFVFSCFRGRSHAVTTTRAALVCGCAVVIMGGAACSSKPVEPAVTATPAAAASGTVPHGDHNPHHGGVVMMKGDLHYEVVLDTSGRAYQVYFTDAVREDLPASIASAVTLTIKRMREKDEPIPMAIDDNGESWVGRGREVRDPLETRATVTFTIAREPYSIDIPFAVPAAGSR